MIRGSPRTPDSLLKLPGNICIGVKGRWTVTGACGPYNLGGSATEALMSLEATGKLCCLVSRPVRDLVRKVASNAMPKGQRWGAPEPW